LAPPSLAGLSHCKLLGFELKIGTPHTQLGGDQVAAKNVVVLEVVHDLSFVDPKYGAIPKAKLVNNEGIAYVFRMATT